MSSNRYEAEKETREQAHSNSVRSLGESRQRLKQALTMAEGNDVPPFRTVLNTNPPTMNDITGGHTQPYWADALRTTHAAALEFWDECRPYRKHALAKWQEDLCQVQYPKEGNYTAESKRHGAPVQRRGLDYETTTISLDGLGWWRFRQVALACKKRDETKERIEKVYLPPIASHSVFEQLLDVLEELGLGAEVREAEGHDRDPGVPQDIDAWEMEDE